MSNTLFQSATSLAAQQRQALARLQLFSLVTKTGFEHVLVLEKAHGKPDSPTPQFVYVHDNGIQDLYYMLTVRMYTIWEAFCSDCIRRILSLDEGALRSPDVSKLKRPIGEMVFLPRDQLLEAIYRDFVESIRASLKTGVGRAEEAIKALGYGATVPEPVKRAIFKMSQYRHCIVHCDGVIDHRLASSFPDLSDKVGVRIKLSIEELREFFLATVWYLNDVPARIAAKFDISCDIQSVQDEIIAAFSRVDKEASGLPFTNLNTKYAEKLPYGVQIVVLAPLESSDGGSDSGENPKLGAS